VSPAAGDGEPRSIVIPVPPEARLTGMGSAGRAVHDLITRTISGVHLPFADENQVPI